MFGGRRTGQATGAALKAERVLARGVGFETSFFLSRFDNRAGHTRKPSSYAEDRKGSIPLFSTGSPPTQQMGNARWLDSPPSSLIETETSPRRSGFYASVSEVDYPGSIPGEETRFRHPNRAYTQITCLVNKSTRVQLPYSPPLMGSAVVARFPAQLTRRSYISSS